MQPIPAAQALDRYFLEARSKLLDLAGFLDRIGRAGDHSAVSADPRLEKIHKALKILGDPEGNRAERIQKTFSLDYDPSWKKPAPKS